MCDAQQENVWLDANIVLWVHGEFVNASQMLWRQSEDTKQSHKAHQKWSFCLVSGSMTQQMHHATQKFSWFGDDIVMCVHGELVIATEMSWHQFEDSKRANYGSTERGMAGKCCRSHQHCLSCWIKK